MSLWLNSGNPPQKKNEEMILSWLKLVSFRLQRSCSVRRHFNKCNGNYYIISRRTGRHGDAMDFMSLHVTAPGSRYDPEGL